MKKEKKDEVAPHGFTQKKRLKTEGRRLKRRDGSRSSMEAGLPSERLLTFWTDTSLLSRPRGVKNDSRTGSGSRRNGEPRPERLSLRICSKHPQFCLKLHCWGFR